MCILGIGTNGHIAFNEPGSSFKSRTRVVDLSLQTRQDNSRFFDSAEDVPKQAITMGLATIMESKKIILMANGKNKFEILNKAKYGDKPSQVFDFCLSFLILANLAAVCLESVKSINEKFYLFFLYHYLLILHLEYFLFQNKPILFLETQRQPYHKRYIFDLKYLLPHQKEYFF